MAINTQHARELLRQFDFRRLFAEELCWASPPPRPIHLDIDGLTYTATSIAEQGGMMVFEVLDVKDGLIPGRDIQLKASRRIAQTYAEHILIFVNTARTSSLWLWVKRQDGRYQPRDHRYSRSQAGDSLLQKLAGIAFELEDLDEEGRTTIGIVLDRVQSALDIEKVTKRFYEQFKKEHAVFLKFITGIAEKADHEWYASVMLNRLMFVYFIQRKGFLDGDRNYLRNRLDHCQQEKGKDKFYSFYRYFLLRLFHEGLGGRTRTPMLEKLLGRIPYLNGGLFEQHQIEKDYPKIEIPDKAFERIFDYFDQYQWHLDERPLRADNEINPDVLGYIFEKYINQKQMGAYYTKEDITGYISKNTVLPFLFDATRTKCKVAFENPNGPTVWDLLKVDPDRYIYPAVRHGVEQPLPPEIAEGVDTSKPKLSERRKDWNKAAPAEYALPTETWREVVARRQRYDEVHRKLAAGEVREINDLITLNLDIRQFAQDAIENSEGPELLRAFWYAIEKVTILDPTSGSGAFLFAVLNILEPLYEACLDRMEAFVADIDRSGEKHRPEKFSDFRKVLARVAAHPNRRYFIFKSIILNNLFGVDIMEEAVEICKLRLFLKLAAQVEPDTKRDNLGIEPLPDIDFNIKAGNTLVGFATYDDAKRAIKSKLDFDNAMEKISVKAADLQQAFDVFRQRQIEGDGSVPTEDKLELRKRLSGLQDELNRYLAGEYGVGPAKKDLYAKWLKSHQPFHWFVQFYGIMNGGGFDVIIGNPPYTEIPKELGRPILRSAFKSALERWSRDEDLYTLVVERSLQLLREKTGQFGMILPLSLAFSTKRPFAILRRVLAEEQGLWYWSHFDRIPSALFGNDVRTRCTIALLSRAPGQRFAGATTALHRWTADFREYLFGTISYARLDVDISAGIPKVSSQIQADAVKRLTAANTPLALDLTRSIPFNELAEAAPHFPQPCVYVGGTAYNWFPAWRDIPETVNIDGKSSLPARTAGFRFSDEDSANIVFALLCSSMGYWWWAVASDAFNLKKWLLERFPVSLCMIPAESRKKLAQLGASLRRELKHNYVYKDNKGRVGNFFLPACEKESVAIDTFLASSLPGLSLEFFEDIRGFNSCFSRIDMQGDEEGDDE